jgi:glycosyltransferase involved in cell wall biosynthesis
MLNEGPCRRCVFWSSVEYLSFMSGLIEALNEQGWDASHQFSISASAYRSAKSKPARVWLRIRMYIIYPLQLLWRAWTDRSPSIWIVCTNTFYAPLLATLAAQRRTHPIVHNVYDLFPDVLYLAGGVKRNSLVARICAASTRATFRRACLNVTLGKRLDAYARRTYGEDITRTTVIPIGADGASFRDAEHIQPAQDRVALLYCGNLGFMHDIQTLVDAIREWLVTRSDERLRFVFHTSGPQLARMKAALSEIEGDCISFGAEGLAEAEWQQAMREAHVGIATMIPGAEDVLMPSKAFAALVAGQAILAVCPRESDLAELIERHDCGWVVQPGDVDSLLTVFESLLNAPQELLAKRRNAYHAGHTVFDSSAIAQQWDRVLTPLLMEGPTS